MKDAVVECVPNFSEGRDARRVEAIVTAMRVEGVRLLDWTRDADHNRCVVTVAGAPAAVLESAVRGVGKAVELIDLTTQQGVHPRIGAADVVPFVPVSGMKLEQCVMLARQAGLEIWRRFGVPVYFYEAAASRPDRANLDDVRRGLASPLPAVVLSSSSDQTWQIQAKDKKLYPVTPKPVVRLSSLLMVREATLEGTGAALLPGLLVQSDIADGKLVPLGLDAGPPVEIWALYSSRRFLSAKVRAFIDMLDQADVTGA